ncbi:helix-turn-helix transcriptional regulator [Parachryseolinea silvisoli]|uniref:helix-turn-helix transcriptional regulator n=1 Tax=Parachryseolinea silvisoli TaxID=2873601 RepID=UPI00226596EE|nr:AraC family transcriptional regulator [Parachryseolinea silvisoli]MCD9015318.1 AraC family transcriptional regulator [Parachryseolinea silvisoli]
MITAQQTLSYNDVLSCLRTAPQTDEFGFIRRVASDHTWGRWEERLLVGDHYRLTNIQADLTSTVGFQFEDEHMLHSLNVCAALDGNIGLYLPGSGFSTGLQTRRHHVVHSCETAYTLTIPGKVNVLHLSIDRAYYTGLLCDQERWMAQLKERLLKKEQVVQGDAELKLEMSQVIQHICNNPLRGTLGKLMIEAKILELVALQLTQFAGSVMRNTPRTPTLRPADRDTFYALREHLDIHFASDLSLRSLSRTFGLNEFKLKKGFKELFQTTVFDHIHTRRMEHARYLLADQKMYVHQVANLVGYKNANHFSTAFKRTFGVKPTSLG